MQLLNLETVHVWRHWTMHIVHSSLIHLFIVHLFDYIGLENFDFRSHRLVLLTCVRSWSACVSCLMWNSIFLITFSIASVQQYRWRNKRKVSTDAKGTQWRHSPPLHASLRPTDNSWSSLNLASLALTLARCYVLDANTWEGMDSFKRYANWLARCKVNCGWAIIWGVTPAILELEQCVGLCDVNMYRCQFVYTPCGDFISLSKILKLLSNERIFQNPFFKSAALEITTRKQVVVWKSTRVKS